eukprot:TRINITY_DN31932_c0_g1_i1.p1 TRINITY_DN31932_c0_g1~~TRINITY_DN31932_c0_g1_i1.p1  ORF type:complete len:350 (+),score=70.79 TRINITY_DN31932_c0_g1_i1:67-1050(+)
MTSITWGIIGAGDVAEKKSGPAFNKVEGSELKAVMRRSSEKAKDFADRHGVPKWFDNVDGLLVCEDINSVYIATPPSSHCELAKQSLMKGKNVYLEKPMCLTPAECRDLSTVSATAPGKLCVAHYRRHLPCFLKVKELIDGGAIGDVSMASIRFFMPKKNTIIAENAWRLDPKVSGGGLFHDVAPHHIDMMLYLFGATQNVSGQAFATKGSPVADVVSGRILFSSGVCFTGIWNFSVAESCQEDVCEIHGTEGKISFSFFGETLMLVSGSKSEQISFTNPVNVQHPMIAEVVKYFRGETNVNPCSAEDGTNCVEILEKFTENQNFSF